MKRFLFIGLFLLTSISMSSQSLSEYQWENRLVIIFTENESSEKLNKQLKIFEKNIDGLKDRKLIILHSTPQKQREIFSEESGWQDNLFSNKRPVHSTFTENQFDVSPNDSPNYIKQRGLIVFVRLCGLKIYFSFQIEMLANTIFPRF